jgi:hypothetical protein
MKKFYYLDNKKHWRGPYPYVGILYLTLTGKIGPHNYLWHNKLTTDIGPHPSQSIYTRLGAREHRSLPMWVFGSNLKILAKNSIKKFIKLFKKKGWEDFVSKPHDMPMPDAGAIDLFLIPSIAAIHDFAAPENFKVKLGYIDTSDEEDEVKFKEYPIRLFMDESPGIRYEITMPVPPRVRGVLHQESYGLQRNLLIKSGSEKIEIAKNSAFHFSTNFGYAPQTLKGRFKQANHFTERNFKQCYNRLIIKTGDADFIGPNDIVESTGWHWTDHEGFNLNLTLMGITYRQPHPHTEISFGGSTFRIYSLSKGILVIEGLEAEDLSEFKKHEEVIRTALALLSGKFYTGRLNYIAATDPGFKEIDGIWYEMDKEHVISSRRLIDLNLFRMTFKPEDEDYQEKYKEINTRFNSEIFSALCERLYENENMMHAASLVVTAMGNADPLQQGALYSVALETLTTELGERKKNDLNPIDDKELAKKIAEDMRTVLASYDAELSDEAKIILTKKIAGLNSPTNRDKLVKTFTLYGIALSQEDIAVIDKRNDYLHGRNPLNSQQQFELNQISLRLHTLIVSLILKVAGYSGHVVNLDNAVYVTDPEKLYQEISEFNAQTLSLYQKLKAALLTKRLEEANGIRMQIVNLAQGQRLENFIRTI